MNIWERLEAHFRVIAEKQDRAEIDLVALQKRLADRAKNLRSAVRTEDAVKRFDALYFRIGAELYAVRVSDAGTVYALTNFTPVPGAPSHLRGVAHLRGDLLTLLDIGFFLGMDRRGLADLRRAIVVGSGARRLAILAGEVEDIFSVPETSVTAPPHRASGERASCVEGIVGGDRLLLSVKEILEQVLSS